MSDPMGGNNLKMVSTLNSRKKTAYGSPLLKWSLAWVVICVTFSNLLPRAISAQVPSPATGLYLNEIIADLKSPVYLTAPIGDSRLFVVERPGRILILEDNELLPTPFLDITDLTNPIGEGGLLSVAFHPRYAENGYFYVNYTDPFLKNTVIERYTVSANDPNVADPASRKLILTIPQPPSSPSHKGGLNMFGPDGMLYIGMGEGLQLLKTRTTSWEACSGSMWIMETLMPSRRTTPSSGRRGHSRRFGRRVCATPGGTPLTGRRITFM